MTLINFMAVLGFNMLNILQLVRYYVYTKTYEPVKLIVWLKELSKGINPSTTKKPTH